MQLPYIKSRTRRYSAYHRDDAFGCGVLGLVKAARRYKATGGAQFFSYAKHWIDGGIKDYWEHSSKFANDTSLAAHKEPHYVVNVARYIERKETGELLQKAMGEIGDRQAAVIRLYYLEGMTLEEIAKQMCCSKASVLYGRNRALGKLQKKMEAYV